MVTRNYITHINNGLSQLSEAQQRITSGRKYTRVSQNVADGMRALRVRKQLQDNQQEQTMIRDARGVLASAESNLESINSIMETARGVLLKMENGTNEKERNIAADQFNSYKNQVLQFMNSTYADCFLFSGTNNAEAPFKAIGENNSYQRMEEVTIQVPDPNFVADPANPDAKPDMVDKTVYKVMEDTTGMVTYNGAKYTYEAPKWIEDPDNPGYYLPEMIPDPADPTKEIQATEEKTISIPVDWLKENDPEQTKDAKAKYMIKNPAFDDTQPADPDANPQYVAVEIPMNTERYIDLGMGYEIGQFRDDYEVDPRTAFKLSFDGLEILGCGTTDYKLDTTTYELPNNLYSLLDQAEKMLRDPEKYKDHEIGAICDYLEGSRQEFYMSVMDIGNRTNFLDEQLSSLESEEVNLSEVRKNLEGTDDYRESMNVKMFEYTWLATLRMGDKILPQSLMDFIS